MSAKIPKHLRIRRLYNAPPPRSALRARRLLRLIHLLLILPTLAHHAALMAARTCLGAIDHEAKDCIATKFPNGATSAEVLQCLNEAIGKTGATSLPDSRAMPPAGRQEPRSGGGTVDLDGGVLQ